VIAIIRPFHPVKKLWHRLMRLDDDIFRYVGKKAAGMERTVGKGKVGGIESVVGGNQVLAPRPDEVG